MQMLDILAAQIFVFSNQSVSISKVQSWGMDASCHNRFITTSSVLQSNQSFQRRKPSNPSFWLNMPPFQR